MVGEPGILDESQQIAHILVIITEHTNDVIQIARRYCGKADFPEMVDSRRDGPEGQGPRDRKGTGGQGATEEKRPLGSSR